MVSARCATYGRRLRTLGSILRRSASGDFPPEGTWLLPSPHTSTAASPTQRTRWSASATARILPFWLTDFSACSRRLPIPAHAAAGLADILVLLWWRRFRISAKQAAA